MDKYEYIQHWNYFCSLAKRLDETKDYVFHGGDESDPTNSHFIHGNVYSDIFKQIIILSASEFELISKVLCNTFGETAKDIIDISRIILFHFPKLPETEVYTAFYSGAPLQEWRYCPDNKGKKVEGLKWWDGYNALKHNEVDSYKQATLENAILAESALYVVNLYLMRQLTGTLYLAYNYPPVYFRNKYTASTVNSGEGLLPDFGNKSAEEVLRGKYQGIT